MNEPALSRGDTLEVTIDRMAHGGLGIGHAPDGRVVFARFGLPGERVRVEVTGERSSLVRGDVVEVLDRQQAERDEHRGVVTVGGDDDRFGVLCAREPKHLGVGGAASDGDQPGALGSLK